VIEASPTVSVVIPCYNGARFLRATLGSVLAQTHLSCEVIVVDDGSTDDSAGVAESFGPPVRVIRQPNQGESVARNRGIDEAQGEWIAFLDADDVWLPEKTERQLHGMASDTRASCTGYFRFDQDPTTRFGSTAPDPAAFTLEGICRGAGCPCQISSLLVRRDVSPRFPTRTKYGEDMIYMLDLLARCPVQIVSDPLIGYRRHQQSQSARADIAIHWHEAIETWIAGNGQTLGADRARELRALLSAALVARCETAYWQRQWRQFQVLRDYVASKQLPLVDSPDLLRRRVWPRWSYTIKDWLDRPFGTNRA
jgi:glycosyltransferase involved in cell wall biosynthesis